MKQYIFSISLLLLIVASYAQEVKLRDDTLLVQYSENEPKLIFKDLPYYELDGFQQYRPFGMQRLPLMRSGNLGLPTQSFSILKQDWDINYLSGAYQNYLMDKNSMRFYKMSRPFTRMRYTNGAKSEQLFNLLHSQNLGKGLNISFEYQKTVSEGFFIQQLSNHTQFNTTYNLKSRNQRFSSKGYFLINDIEAQENGGVVLSEENNEDDNTVLLSINLKDTNQNKNQNQLRTQGLNFENGYVIIQKDTSFSILALSHEIEWNKSSRLYKDDVSASPTFYDAFFFDTLRTADTSYAELLSNTIEFNLFNNSLNVGYKNEQYHYFQNYFLDTDFESEFIIANIASKVFNQKVDVSFEKGISGFHEEEFDINARVEFQEWKEFKSTILIDISAKEADYLLQNQRSNHAYFNEDFTTSKHSSVAVKIEKEKWDFSIEVGAQEYMDFIYFDKNREATQYNESISNVYVELNKKFNFLKHFYLFNRVKYQQISEEEILPLPELFSYHSFYYENDFVKSALKLQLGVDFYYISEYNGYSYSPDLAQFHLAKNSNTLGGINQLDLFMNIGINKSARLFVKMENVLSKSFSEDTYRIQNYPIPGRALKVGFSWRMVN